MRSPIEQAVCFHFRRRHDQVTRHREVAVKPLAHGHFGMVRLDNVGKAPARNDPVAVLGDREKFPVADALADDAIGDVVGGQRKTVDFRQHLAVLERRRLAGFYARFRQIGLADDEFADGCHCRLFFAFSRR